MNGETGQLQRLTDGQVSARLAAYNPGGALDRDIEMLRDNAADLIAAEIVAQYAIAARHRGERPRNRRTVSGNETAMLVVRRPAASFARPGIALPSWISAGRRARRAAVTTGKLG